MSKIRYKKSQENIEPTKYDRNCFLYGICGRKDPSKPENGQNVPECHKITQFGLKLLSFEKNEEICDNTDNVKTESGSNAEKSCLSNGRSSEDPFNDLLNDLSRLGLKKVNRK